MKKFVNRIKVVIRIWNAIHITRNAQNPVRLRHVLFQGILGINKNAYWPMHPASTVVGVKNVKLGKDVAPGYMSGCYIQGIGPLEIGDYTEISGNVAILTANHDKNDFTKHEIKGTKIGANCWIGYNSVILPGVQLGDNTIVGAGSVVSRSFPEGNIVIVGNPAKKVRDLPAGTPTRRKCLNHGFLSEEKFSKFLTK